MSNYELFLYRLRIILIRISVFRFSCSASVVISKVSPPGYDELFIGVKRVTADRCAAVNCRILAHMFFRNLSRQTTATNASELSKLAVEELSDGEF
jgi:hypothetical protein